MEKRVKNNLRINQQTNSSCLVPAATGCSNCDLFFPYTNLSRCSEYYRCWLDSVVTATALSYLSLSSEAGMCLFLTKQTNPYAFCSCEVPGQTNSQVAFLHLLHFCQVIVLHMQLITSHGPSLAMVVDENQMCLCFFCMFT